MPTKTLEQRFWAKVDRSGGEDACWIWQGGHDIYGAFSMRQPNGKWRNRGAHRVSYLIAHGTLDPDLEVCHTCDVPLCVNPAHLFQGTRLDNARDCWQKGRGKNPLIESNRLKTHCPKGHEYTPDNTRVKHYANWSERLCKTCVRERRLAWKAAHPDAYRESVVRSMQRRKERGETPEQRERRLAYFREYNAKRRSRRIVRNDGVSVANHESEGLSRAS